MILENFECLPIKGLIVVVKAKPELRISSEEFQELYSGKKPEIITL